MGISKSLEERKRKSYSECVGGKYHSVSNGMIDVSGSFVKLTEHFGERSDALTESDATFITKFCTEETEGYSSYRKNQFAHAMNYLFNGTTLRIQYRKGEMWHQFKGDSAEQWTPYRKDEAEASQRYGDEKLSIDKSSLSEGNSRGCSSRSSS